MSWRQNNSYSCSPFRKNRQGIKYAYKRLKQECNTPRQNLYSLPISEYECRYKKPYGPSKQCEQEYGKCYYQRGYCQYIKRIKRNCNNPHQYKCCQCPEKPNHDD